MSEIVIRPVTDRRTLRDFLRVPRVIYADDKNWVEPLLFERKQALSPRNPFFEHAQWQGFVAYRDDLPQGRISAQIDKLYLERHHSATGFFGLIEAVDDPIVFENLFCAAEQWLREKGMTRIVGPFNLGINQEVGLLVEGFDTPPFIMMGHGRRYYADAVEFNGYTKAVDMLAYEAALNTPVPPAMTALYRRYKDKVQIRHLDPKHQDRDLETMRNIFNDAWQDNWGFVPFTEAEFHAIGSEMLMLIPENFISITELDGEPVAFAAMIPNINEAIADLGGSLFPVGWAKLLWRLKVRYPSTGRVPLMGVRSRFHQTRIGAALAFQTMYAIQQPALNKGIKQIEMSWILETNKGMCSVTELLGGRISKRYRMYEKSLETKAETSRSESLDV